MAAREALMTDVGATETSRAVRVDTP